MTQPSKVAQFVGFETVEKGNNLAGQSMNYGDSQDVKFVDDKQSPRRRRPEAAESGRGSPGRGGGGGGGGGGASVPKFGEWNANPALADGYTYVFDRIMGNPELADRFVSSNEFQEDTENGVPRNVDINFKPPGDSPGRPKQAKGGCFSWLCG